LREFTKILHHLNVFVTMAGYNFTTEQWRSVLEGKGDNHKYSSGKYANFTGSRVNIKKEDFNR